MVHQAQGQMVQEVAAGSLPAPPSRYVLREEHRPIGGSVAAELLDFPTVDLQRLAEPGDVAEATKLRSALESWGLFAVRMFATVTFVQTRLSIMWQFAMDSIGQPFINC